MQPVRELGIALRLAADQLGKASDLASEPGVESRVGRLGEITECRGRIVREIGGQFLRRDLEQSRCRRASDHKTGGCNQHQLADPMRLTDRELRGKPSAEREPGEVELLKAKLVEQIHVVKDVILDGVDRLGVIGVAEARVIGDDDGVPFRPNTRHLEAGEGAGAVQEHECRAAPDAVDDGAHAVDRIVRAREAGEIG